jgi:S1-C subfamily serine protease
LLDRDGRLVGIGSLLVGEAVQDGKTPGNMFIPIDTIRPILADMVAFGHAQGAPKPWLGITSQEFKGRLFVQRVTPNGPAAQAGIKADDLIVGVKGEAVGNLGDFYRKIWSLGEAGIEVPLDVLRGNKIEPIVIRSIDRYRFLRLRPSL